MPSSWDPSRVFEFLIEASHASCKPLNLSQFRLRLRYEALLNLQLTQCDSVSMPIGKFHGSLAQPAATSGVCVCAQVAS